MRLLAFAQLSSVSMLVASESKAIIPEIASIPLQMGALAILSWVIWHMLTKTFPAHNKALRDQREDFLRVLREGRDAVKEDRKQFYDSIVKWKSS